VAIMLLVAFVAVSVFSILTTSFAIRVGSGT
jgi:hypothetical protein